jgi:outer membrane lipoprotein-sorting protein
MPQYSALFDWRLNATFAADTFTFTPPEGARRIQFSGTQAAPPAQ